MLVVLAVTALLAVMLLSTIESQIKKATLPGCSAKLRHLGAVIQNFALENNGRYPELIGREGTPSFDPANPNGSGRQWDAQLLRYLNRGDADIDTEVTAQLFFCPGAGKHPVHGKNSRSYIMNQRIASNASDSGNIHTLQNKHRVLLLVDGGNGNASSPAVRNRSQLLGSHGHNNIMFLHNNNPHHIPYHRHGGVANVLFADGHVETRPPIDEDNLRPMDVVY